MQQGSILAVEGERESGDAVRKNNITAVMSIANTVKTSLGPEGLDKMLVDELGDVTITNDGATILKLLEVEHPAAKVLVELAELQDQEIGDGTTSVVILAAELLKNASELVKCKIHPTTIISGYRLACQEACKYINEHLSLPVEELGRECLVNAAVTSMHSKIIADDALFFADMAVEAVLSVKRTNSKDQVKYPVSAINVLKSHGKRAKDSLLVKGYALNCTIASEAMPHVVKDAKIACIDFNLQKQKMAFGVQVLVNEPEELEKIRQREIEMTTEKLKLIVSSGANVLLTTKGIDDLYLKYLNKEGIMAVRRCTKEDLKRIARITGAELLSSLADLDGNEKFDAHMLGHAEEVAQEWVGDNQLILIKGSKAHPSSSIILRGANDFMCDEMERSVHDALCVVKRVLESGMISPGGGAVEAGVSVYLEKLASRLESRNQLAVAEFARSLTVIPKTLAVNAAKDAIDLLAKLRAFHHLSQTDNSKLHLKWTGLDLAAGVTRDNVEAGVLEPTIGKVKCFKFATEAAISILRIDEHVRLQPENKKDPHSYQEAYRTGQLG
ncbi:T-complex protein 1 subunit alpha-like [Zophobas morio]|jgi:T-complex protein 1 subunit alpha|uniref:T-complex protein 1 subunit alpha-like n=1 Tax=Zophobas morio TaxID=2755281 RepID=UPI00308333CD